LIQLAAMERPPDLLIADYHLDDGALGVNEVTRLRAACGRNLPAILITANRTPELADEAKAADCLVLNKPVKPAQLRAVMSGLVG
jgi:two-component system, sensor histidine kinase